MMAAMITPPSVTTATGQALPCAGTAVDALRYQNFVGVLVIAQTALTTLTLGQIAHIAQRRAACPAQVFLVTVQSFVTDGLHVQMLGMSCSQHAGPKLILKEDTIEHAMLFLN